MNNNYYSLNKNTYLLNQLLAKIFLNFSILESFWQFWLNHYNTQSSSDTTKYYYKISTSSSYSYSIINYEGSSSSGNLYVTSDYQSISSDSNDNYNKGISSGVIIGIAVGSIAVLVILIIIIYRCCCKKSKIDFIPVTQPNNIDPEPILYPPSE